MTIKELLNSGVLSLIDASGAFRIHDIVTDTDVTPEENDKKVMQTLNSCKIDHICMSSDTSTIPLIYIKRPNYSDAKKRFISEYTHVSGEINNDFVHPAYDFIYRLIHRYRNTLFIWYLFDEIGRFNPDLILCQYNDHNNTYNISVLNEPRLITCDFQNIGFHTDIHPTWEYVDQANIHVEPIDVVREYVINDENEYHITNTTVYTDVDMGFEHNVLIDALRRFANTDIMNGPVGHCFIGLISADGVLEEDSDQLEYGYSGLEGGLSGAVQHKKNKFPKW